MSHRLHVSLTPRRSGVRLLLTLLLTGLALAASAAPEYALSGAAPQLAKTTIAQTPLGPVSALDLLMLDAVTDHALASIPVTVWLNPGAAEAQPFRPAIQAAAERLATYNALAQRNGDWQPAADQLRVMSFGAATAVWIEDRVRPQIAAMAQNKPQYLETDINRYYLSHPENYLRRQRAQVRYIFRPAKITNPTEQAAARNQLDELAQQIQDKKLSFEDAARKFSAAPSAAQGGLIAPFSTGTHFKAFEDAAFQLERPGQLSPVFQGPEGFYLLQLVQNWPPRNIPIGEVHDTIRDQLFLDLVRHYFNYEYQKLAAGHFVRSQAQFWEYLNMEAPVAQIDKTPLSRDAYLRYYENPTSIDFQVRWPDILANTATWVEGEMIMQDLEARGLAKNPWIERARQLAELKLKADHVYAREVTPASYSSVDAALKTIQENKQFSAGLRSCHLVRFDIEIRNAEKLAKSEPAELRAAQALVRTISAQLAAGVLPTEPPTNLAEWRKNISNPADLPAAIKNLAETAEGLKWKGLRLRVTDVDWQPIVPGSPWEPLLANKQVGQVSPVQALGNHFYHYMIVEERPIDMQGWAAKPLATRTLAFQLGAARIFHGELGRIRDSGAVKLAF